MSINRKLEEIEPYDFDDFLKECEEKAKELGVNLDYYLEEFV